MSILHPNSPFRRSLSTVFSFETAFVLYLFAGFYKSSEFLSRVPVDLTLLFLIVSVAAGGWVFWKRGYSLSRRALILVAAMAAFSGWVLLSLLWAPPTRYGLEKAIQFAVLNGWALAGAAVVMDGDRRRLRRFYGALLALAFLFALQAMRVYLPHRDVRSYIVLGASYQTVGRLVGLGFVVALAASFSKNSRRWRTWLLLALSLLFFFVLLIVGARGPFVAAALTTVLILVLVQRQLPLKFLFIAALAILYLAGSLWMGPSLRTMYRFNVILAHEVGWELPGAQPSPTPLPTVQPTPAPKPSTPTAQSSPTAGGETAKAATTRPATPSPAKPKPTPRPRIPSPKDIPNKSVELRQERFANAWRLWLSAPLIGAGAGSFAYYYPADQLRVYPHNIILEILSELGLVGIVLWLAMLVIAFRGFVKKGVCRRSLSIIALGFFTFTIMNAMISGDIVSNRHVFTALGLLVATSDLWANES